MAAVQPSAVKESSSPSTEPLDLLVLGSGVAGLSAAVRAADVHGLRVGVLTKGQLDQATTRWAQGGVAAVLAADPDSTDLHLADTLAAGAELCDVDAVRTLVDEGPARVNELIALGAIFDRDVNGELELAREGGHSHPRVVHAGGAATGLEVERALVAAVRRSAAAIYERWFACDLIVEHGRCVGVLAAPRPPGRSTVDARPAGRVAGDERSSHQGTAVAGTDAGTDPRVAGGTRWLGEVRARHVLVATGGVGQLFAVTTNPAEATGDGIAMALRAGAAVADLEFVQFHPTALHHPARPRPLLSEALRGHGAVLRDPTGQRFVDEMLPRDRVSQAIQARLATEDVDHVWLDATGLEAFAQRFPTIAAALAEVGLDPARDWLPVAPAAHYTCGGIVADLDGASSLPGLWVAGEAACNGVHGANRLASNSLLDGMVFGPRVVEAVERCKDGPEATGAMRAVLSGESAGAGGIPGVRLDIDAFGPRARRDHASRDDRGTTTTAAAGSGENVRSGLQHAMTADAGVLRSARSLEAAGGAAAEALAAAGEAVAGAPGLDHGRDAASGGEPGAGMGWADDMVAWDEVANLALVGHALTWVARAREETRGCHARAEHPERSARLCVRFVVGG
ncbi:MAG: L-aspartate oxidase [Acidimicrobiales bacterium]